MVTHPIWAGVKYRAAIPHEAPAKPVAIGPTWPWCTLLIAERPPETGVRIHLGFAPWALTLDGRSVCNGRVGSGLMKHRLRFGGSCGLFWVLAFLAPLAYTAGPDPSWIPGLYDDADLDDVLALVTSSGAAFAPFPLNGASFTPLILAFPKRIETGLAPREAVATIRLRAPPVSRRVSPLAW